MVVVLIVMIMVMVIIVASGFHGRPFPVTTNHPHPLTLQSTIPPFFQHFLVFILASSGFTPFFDPPTAVKEQQRMQDVGSDSGDSSGYLWIPATLQWIESSGIPTTLPCSYWRGPAHWSGGLHALDTMEIKLACCACGLIFLSIIVYNILKK